MDAVSAATATSSRLGSDSLQLRVLAVAPVTAQRFPSAVAEGRGLVHFRPPPPFT